MVALIILSLIISSNAKILRERCFFDADFALVYSNERLVTGLIFNETVEDVYVCVNKCVLQVKCQSFNYHKVKKTCQLLQTTNFDGNARTETADGWTHYETDPENRKIGDNCKELNPCPKHHCEDTCTPLGYNCTCMIGYTGERCQIYVESYECVFPFTYKGITYHDCTRVNNADKLWCAYDVIYKTGRWRYCK